VVSSEVLLHSVSSKLHAYSRGYDLWCTEATLLATAILSQGAVTVSISPATAMAVVADANQSNAGTQTFTGVVFSGKNSATPGRDTI